MTETKQITSKISINDNVNFNNQVDYCVGTGRAGLALQKEYYDQLAYVQEHIGFKHIRGHGLFTDDMAIYHEYEDETGNVHAEYNFTYLDRIMDMYKSLDIKPFLELGFMPEKLASGDQTIFYWKGNTTPPKSYDGWCDLVKATLTHLMERYGSEEVVTWPIEVWNEPNLPGFWKDADMDEYFKLFAKTISAIKSLDKRFRVGGPAVCGVKDEEWITKFLDFCKAENIMPDFITRHHYTTEMPDRDGHYVYQELTDPHYGIDNLHTTRTITDSYEEFAGKEIHITEYNTSYCPNNPIHDTNKNAAYIAHQLSWLGDDNASYSYWTFGDVFEEQGVPFTPFHGGFGLVANGVIPKPTFWTFAFYKKLKGQCIHRSEESVIVRMPDGSIRGIAWNHGLKRTRRKIELNCLINLEGVDDDKEYCIIYKTVDEKVCNPLKVWHDMGEPSSLTDSQLELLKLSANPQVSSDILKSKDGNLNINILLDEFAVVYFECTEVSVKSDRGYSYSRTME